ncbi:Copia protein [Anthophora quadrimaculata]
MTFDVDLSSQNYQEDNIKNGGDTDESSASANELNADNGNCGDEQSRRGTERPRKVRTGMRGRPRKEYNMVQVASTAVEQTFMAEVPLERAIASSDADEWHQAIAIELGSILKNDTWEVVERPKNAKKVGNRIVLCNKYKPNGEIDRRKARIVARGFSQHYGVDFNETFAPVARLQSIRIVTALAAEHNMKIHQIDVTSAYLNGKLKEKIFIEVPHCVDKALDILATTERGDYNIKTKAIEMKRNLRNGDKVCLLRKALYGLKQAGRSWHCRLDKELKTFGLIPSRADPCLY